MRRDAGTKVRMLTVPGGLVTSDGLVGEVLDATSGRSVVWISHDVTGLDRMDRVIRLGGV